MKLSDFLRQIQNYEAVRLIGPFFDENLTPATDHHPTIYIDGGLEFKFSFKHLHFSLGDGDSSPLQPEHLLNPEKDFSDLEFALRQIPPELNTIFLDGFLGGRRDHEWINLGVVYNYLNNKGMRTHAQNRVIFDNGKILAFGSGHWRLDIEGGFSLLCFEETHLRLEGEVKYPYTRPEAFSKLSSLGLSNWGQGQFEMSNDKPVLLIRY